MENFKQILLDEIPNFREKSLAFENGEISKMEYKGFSGGYGAYAQRDQKSFMLRLRVSSGVLSKKQLHTIYHLAYKCNLDKIHLTTRQAIQLHDLYVDQVCNVMKEGIEKDIYTRGGGGNFPRNVALSPLSGVDKGEAFDVAPYAVATDWHFISQITSYHLPRKLKVSYSSCDFDSSHCTVQDLGFIATIKDGKKYFRVFAGGGLGKNPREALELDELIDPSDALYYVDGIVELFKTYGNYENRNKARVRYMVETLGEEEFKKKLVELAKDEKAKGGRDLNPQAIDYSKKGVEIDIKNPRLIPQKQNGLYAVEIHPVGGQLLLKDLKALLYELDKVKNPMIRLAMTEGLFILNLDGNEAKKILEVSESISGYSLLERSVSCIGVPICQVGIQNSQKMLHEIIDFFKENDTTKEIINVMPEIHISGCPNSCGVHQIGTVGLAGKLKRIDGVSTDVFELFMEGCCKLGETKLGESIGDYKASDIPKILFEIGQSVKNSNKEFYTWVKEDKSTLSDIVSKYKI